MAYNKKQHLSNNIAIIELVLNLEKENRKANEDERRLLRNYRGFGGLKCVLNPVGTLADRLKWSKSELELFPLVSKLHSVLRDNLSEVEYKQYFESIKSSILTSFYTPNIIPNVMADALKEQGIEISNFLDPSAGVGSFVNAFNDDSIRSTCYEKDILTGKILANIYPYSSVYVDRFENIKSDQLETYDLVSSNIPFGDFSALDLSYSRSKEAVKQMASRQIHNYFFLKGLDATREGGLLAFITSTRVADSSRNAPIRQYLAENAHLVSAVRFPNNLFIESAGTEVASDLLIFQKETGKGIQSEQELLFTHEPKAKDGIIRNPLFDDAVERKVFTLETKDTNPYGQPAWKLYHSDGVKGIADYLKEQLHRDFSEHLNVGLFRGEEVSQSIDEVISSSQEPEEKAEEIKADNIAKNHTVNIFDTIDNSAPVMSLYDMYFPDEPKSLEPVKSNPTRKKTAQRQRKRSPKKVLEPVSELFPNPATKSLSYLEELEAEEVAFDDTPKPYVDSISEHLKDGSIVYQDVQFGYLSSVESSRPMFNPLDLNINDTAKVKSYIEIRDTYHRLYNNESENKEEDTEERKELNRAYDDFVFRFGRLNTPKNVDAIKMDTGGMEILYLERTVDGKFVKADIFERPVAFNPNELTTVANPDEALSASLNKYGEVNLTYMEDLLPGMEEDELLSALDGRIFFNPLVNNYEVTDRFISGNVVEKAEHISDWIVRNDNHDNIGVAKEALSALNAAKPIPIPFNELDFNLGERWIPSEVYATFATELFETKTSVHYSNTSDEYSVKADGYSPLIYKKYCVKSKSRTFNGEHLLKHALLNTVPDITKKIMVGDKEVKVRDAEAIQDANAKIEEIRSAFPDWLDQQSQEFKDTLTDKYNRMFNSFVRPQYDGSHQNFPDLNLKNLGFEDLYASQKDAIWMLKQNNGGICDHEVLRP